MQLFRWNRTAAAACCVLSCLASFGQDTKRDTLTARIIAVGKLLDKYAAETPEADLLQDEMYAIARLQWEKAGMLNEGAGAGNSFEPQVKLAERAARLVGKLKTLPVRTPGLIERAYIAADDLSSQPYAVYRPKSRPMDRKLPLLIFLHGYAPYLNKLNWLDLMYSPDLEALAEREGLMLLLPFGRSNTEFMGIGEVDVLRTIELTKSLYAVDEDKVFLSGASMGGSGTWTIGCHYPHLFAGLSTIAGRFDYYLWKNLDPEKLTGFKRIQTDADYARALAVNLTNLPSFIFHGGADYLVKVQQSRGMFALLNKLGCPTTYKEFEGGDHWIWGDCFNHKPYAEWLRNTKRQSHPKRVRYCTYTLKYNRAYWVRIDRIARWGKPASVTAEVTDKDRLKLTTENVARLTLLLNDKLVSLPGTLHLDVNGKTREVEAPADGSVPVTIEELPESPLQKTHEICGPIRDVYSGPFLMILGTGGGKDARKLNRGLARKAAVEWAAFSAGRGIVARDSTVTDDVLKNKNLILFGTPKDNSILARIADKLPIKFAGDKYVVGHKEFPSAGTGLLMIYPSPFNPRRYVVVNSGLHWGKHLSINHKFDFLPDFIIFTDERDWDDNNRYLAAGYFDRDWQLRDELTWFGNDEKPALKQQ